MGVGGLDACSGPRAATAKERSLDSLFCPVNEDAVRTIKDLI